VNQWVVVAAEQGERQARQALARCSPALTTAVHEPGLVTVIYPNPLVLQHGFRGKAVFHVTVPVARLRLWKGSAAEKQRLDDALLHAVKSRPCWLDARPALVTQGNRDRSRSRDRDVAADGITARRAEEEEAAAQSPFPGHLKDVAISDGLGAVPAADVAARGPSAGCQAEAPSHEAATVLSADVEEEMEVESPAAEGLDEEDAAPVSETAETPATEASCGRAAPSAAAAVAELPATEEPGAATPVGATPSTPTLRAGRTEGRALARTPEHFQVERSHAARRRRTQTHSKMPYWLPKFTSMASQAFREAGSERMLASKMEGLLTNEVFSKAEFEEGLWHLIQGNKVCRFDDVLFIV